MTRISKLSVFSVLVFSLLFLCYANSFAKQNQKIFTIVSTGSQDIKEGLSPKLKKAAVTSALKSSVERAVSELLTPDVFASNLEVLYKSVLLKPSKYIKNYSVIAELKEETRYVAAVKVNIDLVLLKKHLKRYGIIKSNREKPALLFLISEQSDQDAYPKQWWGEEPSSYESLVTDEIIKIVTAEEFAIVGGSAEKIDLKKYGIAFKSISDTSAAIKLGLKLKADIVITGSAKSFEALNRMGDEKIYEAEIALRMFSVKNQRKIGSIALKATANNLDSIEGNRSALVKAGQLSADEITLAANKYWEENILKKEQMIETKIEGEDYLSSFIHLRKALNSMPEVKSVQTKELGSGQAVVNILFKGNADKLAQAILLKTFDSFGIEIFNVQERSFTIRFVSK